MAASSRAAWARTVPATAWKNILRSSACRFWLENELNKPPKNMKYSFSHIGIPPADEKKWHGFHTPGKIHYTEFMEIKNP
jgi:hypothetical protein